MVAEAPAPPPQRPAIVRQANPRKRALTRWEGLSDEQKYARAKRAYERTWARAAPAYGAKGSPAPNVSYLPGQTKDGPAAIARTEYPTNEAPPVVELSRREVMALSRPKGMVKKGARDDLLHEWTHVYQTPEVHYETGEDAEVGANAFADYYSRKLFGMKGARGTLRSPAGRAYLKKYGPGMWRRRQFGSNYGADPTQIRGVQ